MSVLDLCRWLQDSIVSCVLQVCHSPSGMPLLEEVLSLHVLLYEMLCHIQDEVPHGG